MILVMNTFLNEKIFLVTSSDKSVIGKEDARNVLLEIKCLKNDTEELSVNKIPVWIKANVLLRDLERPSRRSPKGIEIMNL